MLLGYCRATCSGGHPGREARRRGAAAARLLTALAAMAACMLVFASVASAHRASGGAFAFSANGFRPDGAGSGAPGVETGQATDITRTTALLNATVNPNGSNVTECYFEWGPNKSFENTAQCANLPGSGDQQIPVYATLEELQESTTYYFRIYAKNAKGESIGGKEVFQTRPSPPRVVTEEATAVGRTSAKLNGFVSPRGSEVTECVFEYSTEERLGASAPITIVPCSEPPGAGEAPVSESVKVEGLTEGQTYYFRLRAVNALGESGGGIEEFTTLPTVPKVYTEGAREVTRDSATLQGTVTAEGSEVTECYFEWGSTITYGNKVSCESLPEGEKPVKVKAPLTGLSEHATYYIRLVAHNGKGTTRGEKSAFTTLPRAPRVEGRGAGNVTQTAAVLRARVNPEGGNVTECFFEYGTTIAYGSTAKCSSLPGSGESWVEISAPVSGLTANTTYYVRAVAVNSFGRGYGFQTKFTTLAEGAQPKVTKVAPSKGIAGTKVTIKGEAFVDVIAVKFGETEAKFTPGTVKSLMAEAPSGTAGETVDITVTTSAGTSATSSADHFTYKTPKK